MSSRQSRHQNYQQADLQRNNAFGHPAQDEEGTDRCVWQTESGSQNIHDAVCFRSCLVVPLSARLTFLQDQTLSCCRSKSGDPLFVFLLCLPAVLGYMAVRRQQQLATLLLLSAFVLFRSLVYLAGGRAAAISDGPDTARESNLFRTDPDVFLALQFVKAVPSTPLLLSASARPNLSTDFVR